MPKFTRGFSGPHKTRDPRLPPGQYDTGKGWPVLTAEVTPKPDLATWTFTVEGEVEQPTTWTWDEIHALPAATYEGDIHCVTTWSKLGVNFGGVSVDTLLDAAGVRPAASYVLAFEHRVHHQPSARRRDGRQGMGGVDLRRRAPPGATRRPRAPARAAPLLLEERQVGVGPALSSTTTSPASGNATATTTAATRGSSSATRVTDASVTERPTNKWQSAMVVDIKTETARAKTFRLALVHPSPHLAGQHYIVRLSAPDGYTASRSYSVASPPDGSNAIDLTVERLENGEVSTFLHDEVVIGDELEVRGPIGGFFVWKADTPAILVGGGSGIVPLTAMLRLARKTGKSSLVHLVVSVRSPAELFYADELPGPETTIVYTARARPTSRAHPRAAHGRRHRVARHAGADRLRVRIGELRRRGQPSPRGSRRARAPGARRALRPDRLNRPEFRRPR